MSLKFFSGKCRPSRGIARTKRDVLAKCLASRLASNTDAVSKNNRIEIALTYIKHFSCSRYGIRYLHALSHLFLIPTLRFALLLPPLHRVGHWSLEKWNNLPRFKPSGLSTARSSEERRYHERHHFPPSLLEPSPMSTHIPFANLQWSQILPSLLRWSWWLEPHYWRLPIQQQSSIAPTFFKWRRGYRALQDGREQGKTQD